MREKCFMTSDDTEIYCGLCNRPTGSVVENGEFIGSVICTVCFGRTFISKHEVQHAMHDVFEMLRMGLDS
jgi:hypothetical protein